MSDHIYLPVSLGEAIDKLTILDIKLDKIKDDRRLDVQKEYDLLYEKLNDFLLKYNDLYQSMKKVNLLIWDMMDILRDGETSAEEYLRICKECIEYNDIRFRVKNKINYISKSSLKEQKSYKVNRLYIEINDNIENLADFVRPIKYYSFFYDEVIILNKNRVNSILNDMFTYDPTIIFKSMIDGNIDCKKQFIFEKDLYTCDEVFLKFELNDDIINKII